MAGPKGEIKERKGKWLRGKRAPRFNAGYNFALFSFGAAFGPERRGEIISGRR